MRVHKGQGKGKGKVQVRTRIKLRVVRFPYNWFLPWTLLQPGVQGRVTITEDGVTMTDTAPPPDAFMLTLHLSTLPLLIPLLPLLIPLLPLLRLTLHLTLHLRLLLPLHLTLHRDKGMYTPFINQPKPKPQPPRGEGPSAPPVRRVAQVLRVRITSLRDCFLQVFMDK